jgi:hypothetical protein
MITCAKFMTAVAQHSEKPSISSVGRFAVQSNKIKHRSPRIQLPASKPAQRRGHIKARSQSGRTAMNFVKDLVAAALVAFFSLIGSQLYK